MSRFASAAAGVVVLIACFGFRSRWHSRRVQEPAGPLGVDRGHGHGLVDVGFAQGSETSQRRSGNVSFCSTHSLCGCFVVAGYLRKFGGSVKTVKRRWFRLFVGTLAYYKQRAVRVAPLCLARWLVSILAGDTRRMCARKA